MIKSLETSLNMLKSSLALSVIIIAAGCATPSQKEQRVPNYRDYVPYADKNQMPRALIGRERNTPAYNDPVGVPIIVKKF